MKNSIINSLFCFFALSLCSFQMPSPTVQEIFQEALNLEALAEHLTTDDEGEILPQTMATNGLLANSVQLTVQGKKVFVVPIVNNESRETVLDLKDGYGTNHRNQPVWCD